MPFIANSARKASLNMLLCFIIMGTAKYCLYVTLPGNVAVSGVDICAENKDAWFDSSRYWNGTTKDGKYCWDRIDIGVNGDKYDFKLRYADENGVEWRGYFSDRIFNSGGSKNIELRHLFLNEDFEFSIPDGILNVLSTQEGGKEIIAAIRELSITIKKGMAHSSLALTTYILEGMIHLIAIKRGLWKEEFDKDTFGELLNKKELRELYPSGTFQRAEALNKFRIPGVHYKGFPSYIEEAKVGARLILDLSKSWFGNLIGTGEHAKA